MLTHLPESYYDFFFCDMSLNTVLSFQRSAFYETGFLEAYAQAKEPASGETVVGFWRLPLIQHTTFFNEIRH